MEKGIAKQPKIKAFTFINEIINIKNTSSVCTSKIVAICCYNKTISKKAYIFKQYNKEDKMFSHKKRKIESITNRLDSLELEQLIIVDDLIDVFGYPDNDFEEEGDDDISNEMTETERNLLTAITSSSFDEDDDDDSLGEPTTDLMVIVKEADLELAKHVLDTRAIIRINVKNEKGVTPLMWACAFNSSPEVITELIKHNAKIDDVDDKGRTALHHLAGNFNGHLILQPLLDAGIDLNAKDNNEHTALKLAVKEENLDTVLALLKAGANIEDLEF